MGGRAMRRMVLHGFRGIIAVFSVKMMGDGEKAQSAAIFRSKKSLPSARRGFFGAKNRRRLLGVVLVEPRPSRRLLGAGFWEPKILADCSAWIFGS